MEYYFPDAYYQSMLAAVMDADPSLGEGFAANFTSDPNGYWFVNDTAAYEAWLKANLFPEEDIDPWFLQYTSIFTGTSNQNSGGN